MFHQFLKFHDFRIFQLSFVGFYLIFLFFQRALFGGQKYFNYSLARFHAYSPLYYPPSPNSYSNYWLENAISIDFSHHSYDNCFKCSFLARHPDTDSTKHDLVFSGVIDNINGILPFIRSLRSTGCKATLVFIINNAAMGVMTPHHFKQIEYCGVVFHNVGKFNFPEIISALYMPVFDYILKQQALIDRIFLLMLMM
jgi:hypothetical protein